MKQLAKARTFIMDESLRIAFNGRHRDATVKTDDSAPQSVGERHTLTQGHELIYL